MPSEDCQIVFYKANKNNPASTVHIDDSENFVNFVKNGGIIICFVGDCNNTHNIINLIGGVKGLRMGPTNGNPTSIRTEKPSPFIKIFSKYGHQITVVKSLGQTTGYVPTEDLDFDSDKEVVARHGGDDAAIYSRVGKGFYLLLPLFINVGSVSEFILTEGLKDIRPDLYEDKEKKWLEKREYFFLKLDNAVAVKEEIEADYKEKISSANAAIETEREEQKIFNDLLTESGDNLVSATLEALKYVGFEVVDVDKHFEDKDREKEEDLWLFEPGSEDMSKDSTIIAEVKGIKGSASNDDCNVLNTYLKRRMQEHENTKMKGLLIVNHCRLTEPKDRNQAFSAKQIKDAKREGNTLLSTYALFRLIKAEKQSKITKEHIKKMIIEGTGEIELPQPQAKKKEAVTK